MPERHKWTKEDDILVLDLYFRAPDLSAAHPEVQHTAKTIKTTAASVAMRAKNFAALNHLHSGAGLQNIAVSSREVWAEYCYDDRWMLQQLAQTPARNFGEACRDAERLQRDAKAILRRRLPPPNVSRREARRAAMHSLYAAAMQNITATAALSQLCAATHSLRKKAAFSDSLPRAVADFADSCGEEIARQITAAASRAPERISAVESAILRAAVAELLLPQTPPVNVIINEAVELAKEFGAEGGHKIVNGALDKIAARLRENDSPDDARE